MMGTITDILNRMEKGCSLFEKEVRTMTLPTCRIFQQQGIVKPVLFEKEGKVLTTKDSQKVAKSFPKTIARSNNKVLYASGTNQSSLSGQRIAVLFSGGPAAGGHNVLVGIKQALGPDNMLLGVQAGPYGLLEGKLFEIKDEALKKICNTGGFDFLGSDRTKIKTNEQFQAVKKTCNDYKLNGIIIVGGDDSNTNAAVLAEYLFDSNVQVIGVPKTIDGDLQVGSLLPISFGFDTATKIYSELVGNILQDTPSSRKYWHFIKLMGRSASHVALEVALQTKPAVVLISEEVAEKNMPLKAIVDTIANTVVQRAHKGIKHGVVLVPEGLIEFIPEMNSLIEELNDAMAKYAQELADKQKDEKRDFIYTKLTPQHAQLMASLPDYIENMLLAERDAHGNLQVSLIPTEQLLIDMVGLRVKELDRNVKFNTLNHFFGYEGRCGAPSLFDAAYTYNLGLTAGSLVLAGKTGYMAAMTSFNQGGEILAIPLSGLINIERRHGKDELVIEKALVKTQSPAFKYFMSRRESWAKEDHFCSPGPRQLWGPTAKQLPILVALNQGYEDLHFAI